MFKTFATYFVNLEQNIATIKERTTINKTKLKAIKLLLLQVYITI